MSHFDRPLLVAIRAVHSAIFLVELGSILWLLVTGLAGRRDRTVAVAASLVVVESSVFVLNDGVCPLTPLAERHGAARGSVSDIFLPDAVARTIPIWSTALLAVAFALHLRAWLRARGRDRGALPVPADQRWFWTDRWQAMEHEVDDHVDAGRVVGLDGPDELFAHLDHDAGGTTPLAPGSSREGRHWEPRDDAESGRPD